MTKEENKRLVEEYPFLMPRDYSGEPIEGYDYEYTLMDAMPEGWRKAFGDALLKELKEELVKSGLLDEYRIVQIKEKYGELRWYDNGNTRKGHDILTKYCVLSGSTCIKCGKLAKYMSRGWISPYCEDCVPNKEFADII